MTRAELIANAETMIADAGRNLDALIGEANTRLAGRLEMGNALAIANLQAQLALACIDLARLK